MSTNPEITKTPEIGPEGFLMDPAEWTEDIAEFFAAQESITLTEDHWTIIRFMRDYWEQHHVAPDVSYAVRFVKKHMRASRNRLFELFPYGYPQQACKIAGMRKPRAWSTG